MPPKAVKTIAYRRKLPVHRPAVDSPPSPSPPAKKRQAATTSEAPARELPREASSTFPSKRVEVTVTDSSSSSSSSESSDTSDSSSPINETNVYEKVDELVGRSQIHDEAQSSHIHVDAHRSQIHGDTSPQGVHHFGREQDGEEEEEEEKEEEREQVLGATALEQEQTSAQAEGPHTAPQEQPRNEQEEEEEEEEEDNVEVVYETPSASKKRKSTAVPRQGIRELHVSYFKNEESTTKFYKGFHSRPVHVPKLIDFDYLEEHKFNFETLITMQNWKLFLRRVDPIYHELVLLFHWNWDPKTFSSNVKGTKITLGSTMEEAEARLGKILKIPHPEDRALPTTATMFNALSGSAKYGEGHTVMKTNELSVPNRLLR